MDAVCTKHDRYVHAGEACPYCEPASLDAATAAAAAPAFWGTWVGYVPPPDPQKLQQSMNRLWCELVSE